MPAALIVRHRVADFAEWKLVFDSMIPIRKEFGFLGHRLYQDPGDPNLVTIVNLVRDVDSAKRYGGSAELKAGMAKAGVQGPPDVHFLAEAEALTY